MLMISYAATPCRHGCHAATLPCLLMIITATLPLPDYFFCFSSPRAMILRIDAAIIAAYATLRYATSIIGAAFAAMSFSSLLRFSLRRHTRRQRHYAAH